MEEVAKLIQDIFGSLGDAHIKQLVAVKAEIAEIKVSERYHRSHSIRREIVERLEKHF